MIVIHAHEAAPVLWLMAVLSLAFGIAAWVAWGTENSKVKVERRRKRGKEFAERRRGIARRKSDKAKEINGSGTSGKISEGGTIAQGHGV